MGWLTSPEGWIAFITLTALEIVLGIDNIIFISILTSRLPANQQARARRLGLSAAMIMRVLLLLSLSWMMRLTTPLFRIVRDFSGRDLILIIGGFFFCIRPRTKSIRGSKGKKTQPTAWTKSRSAFRTRFSPSCCSISCSRWIL